MHRHDPHPIGSTARHGTPGRSLHASATVGPTHERGDGATGSGFARYARRSLPQTRERATAGNGEPAGALQDGALGCNAVRCNALHWEQAPRSARTAFPHGAGLQHAQSPCATASRRGYVKTSPGTRPGQA
ncbi:hypothetical protein RCH14_001480 [Massilia sp. MP_M2]|uniref:hypothetical protein n=1 Tax=Massilia sp. MP_M2 TaxID=3071713 RepID=UPI00319EB9A6